MNQNTAPDMAVNAEREFVAGLRRRRDTAHRSPPLSCGHRDPLDCYGLTEAQRSAEAIRLLRRGWTLREVVDRLGAA